VHETLPPRERARIECCELVLRNYDPDRAYHVTVELTATETAAQTTRSVRLAPGDVRCPAGIAPRGPTRVVARLDGGQSDAVDGVLGADLAETALVETGNGVVSATRGL
jgi:hypothetical protein